MTARSLSPRPELNAERLRELLHYDPATGLFRRKIRTSNRIKAGDVAGTGKGKRYVLICVDGVQYRAHRLAWLYVHGKWPRNDLDHEDRDKKNNRIDNLRPATRKENMENALAPRNSKTGVRGVYWDSERKMWAATIHHHKKTISGGRFASIAEAISARKLLEARFFTRAPA